MIQLSDALLPVEIFSDIQVRKVDAVEFVTRAAVAPGSSVEGVVVLDRCIPAIQSDKLAPLPSPAFAVAEQVVSLPTLCPQN